MTRPDLPPVVGEEDAIKPILAECRFGVRMCVVGLILAYVLGFPLKRAGLMPVHLSWLGLAVVPAAMFGFLGSLFAGPLWFGRRWWLLVVLVGVLCWAAMFGLIWWERG